MALIAAIGLSTAAFADDSVVTDPATGFVCGEGYGRGWQADVCNETTAGLLGLTVEELQAARLEGKTLVDIAAEQGITEEALVAALIEAKTTEIQNQVAAGTMTQERAEYILQNIEQKHHSGR